MMMYDLLLYRMSLYSGTCLRWSLKLDIINVLKTDDSLIQVKSMAECSRERSEII